MFLAAKYYMIVSNNSFIVRKDKDDSEITIELKSFMPNVPSYHHLFDEDKLEYLNDIGRQVKSLKIKNTTMILPDDTLTLDVDKRIVMEFLMQTGTNKIGIDFQCLYLNSDSKQYISLSKTSRNIVMHYISYNKALSTRYYDKSFADLEQLSADMKRLHADCEYNVMPVYLNNINNNMEEFSSLGNLVSLESLISNIKKRRQESKGD